MSTRDSNKKRDLALITGAAHRLGRSIARYLAEMGYAVAIHFNDAEEEAQKTVREIQSSGSPAFCIQADLTQENQIEEMFAKIDPSHYSLKVLVNSAAVMLHTDIHEMSVAEWDLTMDLNLRAVWLCSRRAFDLMQPDGGCIINISDSGAGRLWTGYPAYTISKAGVDLLTRLMAKSYAPNIRVNAISPGLIMPPDDFSQSEWERLVQRLPLNTAGSPHWVCDAIGFILRNEYITGQMIAIDGGYQLV